MLNDDLLPTLEAFEDEPGMFGQLCKEAHEVWRIEQGIEKPVRGEVTVQALGVCILLCALGYGVYHGNEPRDVVVHAYAGMIALLGFSGIVCFCLHPAIEFFRRVRDRRWLAAQDGRQRELQRHYVGLLSQTRGYLQDIRVSSNMPEDMIRSWHGGRGDNLRSDISQLRKNLELLCMAAAMPPEIPAAPPAAIAVPATALAEPTVTALRESATTLRTLGAQVAEDADVAAALRSLADLTQALADRCSTHPEDRRRCRGLVAHHVPALLHICQSYVRLRGEPFSATIAADLQKAREQLPRFVARWETILAASLRQDAKALELEITALDQIMAAEAP